MKPFGHEICAFSHYIPHYFFTTQVKNLESRRFDYLILISIPMFYTDEDKIIETFKDIVYLRITFMYLINLKYQALIFLHQQGSYIDRENGSIIMKFS